MKKIFKKSIVIIGGLLATIGITVSNVPAHNTPVSPTKELQNITKSTPLYLEHASNLYLDENVLSWHYSHQSHESHWSHSSHQSHQSHMSHYSS